MPESDQTPKVRRYCVQAKNRREAVAKLVHKYPLLKELYQAGPNNDGKGGWVNAIKDQHQSAYRVLFYLDRLPLAAQCRDKEPYEILYGNVSDSDQPNYPRVLFTTTGGVNLVPDGLPESPFGTAIRTDSLEIVPVTFERDLRTASLVEQGYAYICLYDGEVDALRIIDLRDYTEIYMVEKRREVQVRTEEEMVIGDATFVHPFFLKYRVKDIDEAVDPRDAVRRMLDN